MGFGPARHVTISCSGCGAEFQRYFAKIRFEANYCNQACWVEATRKRGPLSATHRQALSERFSGATHPRWRGGAAKDKAHQKQLHREWCQRNRESLHAIGARRRARKRGATGSHTVEEWLQVKARCDSACLGCGRREPDIKLTRDHIVPISKGGSDFIANIQPLCCSCNSRKKDSLWGAERGLYVRRPHEAREVAA
jgi:5-methylcytosine-specific restriction endonuclease McrA